MSRLGAVRGARASQIDGGVWRVVHGLATESNLQKRRPPCRHGGLESREETPKEGICGRSCRTATISVLLAALASVFFIPNGAAH